MKINNVLYIVFTVLLLHNTTGYSQISNDNLDLIVVREDKVIPSMSSDYEFFLADIKSFLEDKNIKDFNYFTLMQDEYMFRHITPIKSLKEIDKNSNKSLAKKLNDPELDLILELMNETIISTKHIVLKFQPNLSFIPRGDSWSTGNTYRKWSYFYFYPGSEKEVEKLLASWKELYKKKDAKMGFRVFTNFIGEEKPLYIFTTWGENPVKYHENMNELSNVLGDDGAALWLKMMDYVRETKTVEGWFLPQYSFAPGMKFAE